MNRRLRTKVPISKKLLQTRLCNSSNVKEAIVTNQAKSACYHNKTTKPKEEVKPRDLEFAYNLKKKVSEPCNVVAVTSMPRSYLVRMNNGRVSRKNSFHKRFCFSNNPSLSRPKSNNDNCQRLYDDLDLLQPIQGSSHLTPRSKTA